MRSGSSSQCPERPAHPSQTQDGQRDPGRRPGRISVVSLGPGDQAHLVPQALSALQASEVIVGYKLYVSLIEGLIAGKTVLATGMTKEVDRCQQAIDQALGGVHVALISSGDAGIYGMAGLVFDICRERELKVAGPQDGGEADLIIEVIPGVAAFNAAASRLGAPLMHDFAAISLSDLLTPWELIEKRLDAAAAADFVICLYNPRSKSRPNLLEKAREILLRHRGPQTPVGIVRRAMREEQWQCVATLGELPFEAVDMQSMVIVGNSATYVWNGWMVTPRGYLNKYALAPA